MPSWEITSHDDVTSDDKFSTVPYYAPTLDYLPEDDATYYVRSIDGFVANGAQIENLCVRVSLVRFPAIVPPGAWDKVEIIKVFVPFSDFRFFGVGSKFFRGKLVSRKHDTSPKSLRSFRPQVFIEGYFGRSKSEDPAALHVLGRHNFSDKHKSLVRIDGTAFHTSSYRGQPLYMPSMEIFRFYFASFDRLLKELILCFAFPEMELPLPWVEEDTGSDGDTFVVTPTVNFADHATCVQIAIWLSNPDLKGVLDSIVKSIRANFQTGGISAPIIPFPDNAKDLRVLVRETKVRQTPNGRYEKARIAQQVLSDNRDMPFSRLLVRDPRAKPNRKPNNVQGPSKPPKKQITDENLSNPPQDDPRKDNPLPRVEYIAPPSLEDAFPGLQRTKYKVEYTKAESVVPPRPSWMKNLKNLVKKPVPPKDKTDNNLPPEPTKRPSLRSPLRTVWKDGKQNFERKTGYRLFLPINELSFTQKNVDSLDLDERCRCTVEALRRCVRENSAIQFESPRALEFKASLDGGQAAKRHVIYSEFSAGGLFGCVLELVRRSERHIAMGIVLRTDREKVGEIGVARIISHYQRRVQLRGANNRTGRENYAGVWPTYRDYDDVHGTRLQHKPPLDSPVFLAPAISEAARSLLKRVGGGEY